jgi:hypothetical protein
MVSILAPKFDKFQAQANYPQAPQHFEFGAPQFLLREPRRILQITYILPLKMGYLLTI